MAENTLPGYREVGPKEWHAFIAAYLGWALHAMDSTLYALVIVAVMKEFLPNPAQAGLLASVTFFAAGVGSWIYGILADSWKVFPVKDSSANGPPFQPVCSASEGLFHDHASFY